MRQVKVVLTCDEGFVADSLRDFASAYEDKFGDFFEVEHGSGFLEFVEVPDPEPSLADIFDKKAKAVRDKREAERQRLLEMNVAERKYIDGLAEKLSFLYERGFKLKKYFGGIVDGWPYNYLTISKGMREVEIKGSSVRRENGTLDVLSHYYANYQHPTLEEVIKNIAEW